LDDLVLVGWIVDVSLDVFKFRLEIGHETLPRAMEIRSFGAYFQQSLNDYFLGFSDAPLLHNG
jgi:hypothetical protein